MDESLLCHESFHEAASKHDGDIEVNPSAKSIAHHSSIVSWDLSPCFFASKEDADNALRIFLDKEMSYMPKPGFANVIESNHLTLPRLRTIRWLLKSKVRLTLSYGTLFLAFNYFDRFISVCKCQEWKDWMVELLSVACLSVASKYCETLSSLFLHEIQMEGLNHSFNPSTIQQMELILLQALEWRIGSVTPFSYVETMMWRLNDNFFPPNYVHEELTARINEVLVLAVSDIKLMEFRPSVLAASAMLCAAEEVLTEPSNIYLTHMIEESIDKTGQKENLARCRKLMEELLKNTSFQPINPVATHGIFDYTPLSPVTVLPTEPGTTRKDGREMN